MKNILLLACALVAVNVTSRAFGEESTVDISWGAFAVDDYYMIGYYDESESSYVPYVGGSLLLVGYFDDSFNIEENKDDFSAVYNAFINNVFIDSATGDSASAVIGNYAGLPGYAGDTTVIDVASTSSPDYGKTVYYLVLEGVTSYDEITMLDVTAYAILSNSSWLTVPVGTELGNPLNLRADSLDVIYGGTPTTYTDSSEVVHNLYTTVAVPEPGYYAALMGLVTLLGVRLFRGRRRKS